MSNEIRSYSLILTPHETHSTSFFTLINYQQIYSVVLGVLSYLLALRLLCAQRRVGGKENVTTRRLCDRFTSFSQVAVGPMSFDFVTDLHLVRSWQLVRCHLMNGMVADSSLKTLIFKQFDFLVN